MERFDTELFIDEVEIRPALWDLQSNEYCNKTAKNQAWQELVDIFGNEEDTLEKKNIFEWAGGLRRRLRCDDCAGRSEWCDATAGDAAGGGGGVGDRRGRRADAAMEAEGQLAGLGAAEAGAEGQLAGLGVAEAGAEGQLGAAARPRGRPSLTSRRSQLSRRSRSSEPEESRPSATSSSSAAEDARLLADRRRQLGLLAGQPAFAAACATAERVLASNVFREQQKVFKGVTEDADAVEPGYGYSVRPLWVFESERVCGRGVSALCWNPACGDLLAAGYGRFHYASTGSTTTSSIQRGAVCVWCVKNPAEPERAWGFRAEVSSLRFCGAAPNLLAAGLLDGGVALIDVSAPAGVCRLVARGSAPVAAPVWCLQWLPAADDEDDDRRPGELLAADQEGRISRYRRVGARLQQEQVMRVPWPEGALRGVAPPPPYRPGTRRPAAGGSPVPAATPGGPVSCFAAALVLAPQPSSPHDYLVGTDAGCVHVCSLRSLHTHRDHFRAHLGPVYSLQYSPFCPQVLLTAGGDGFVRVWRHGVWQALATLRHGCALQAAAWSPGHATVVAAAAGAGLFLWDLRRARPSPASSHCVPSVCTQLAFTPAGQGLVAGDAAGRVHVLALHRMPLPPFFQQDALVAALRAAVLTRPQLQRTLQEMGPPFG